MAHRHAANGTGQPHGANGTANWTIAGHSLQELRMAYRQAHNRSLLGLLNRTASRRPPPRPNFNTEKLPAHQVQELRRARVLELMQKKEMKEKAQKRGGKP